MIQNISIENFRCFDKTEIKGFSRMNLITGKNNSGKTCLLEALYFCLSQDLEGTTTLRYNEGEGKTGDYLMNDIRKGFINFKFNQGVIENDIQFRPMKFVDRKTGDDYTSNNYAKLISSVTEKSPNYSNLIELFDKASIGGLQDIVLNAVKIIDYEIAEIRTYASFPNTLFLKKVGDNKYQPINNYGDATRKIIYYVGVMSNYTKYLLIDEIENGIHYTAQKEVWQMLFKLCQHFDIQLFATTHSHEMITAFEEVCEEYEGEGAYFEMARHAKTNQIIGIKHEIATLEYELETNTAIRGE
jgi:AAA15 family ATPase/GTPase